LAFYNHQKRTGSERTEEKKKGKEEKTKVKGKNLLDDKG